MGIHKKLIENSVQAMKLTILREEELKFLSLLWSI